MATWRDYQRFLRVACRASRSLSALTALAVALAVVAPLGAVAVVGVVVGEVSATAGNAVSPGVRVALWWIIAAGGFLLAQWAAGGLQSAAATALGERIDASLQRDLMRAVMTPDGIRHVEDPHTRDLISVGSQTFRTGWVRPGRLAATVSGLLAGRMVLVGSCLIVASFHPLLCVALLACGLWSAYEDKAASRAEAGHHYGDTELGRRTEYYYELGVAAPAAKEVRVFGLSRFLLDRFSAVWHRSMAAILVPPSPRPLVATVALGSVVLLGVAWIVREAATGRIGAGPAVAYAQALMVSLSGVRQSSWTGLQTELAFAALRRYGEAVAAIQSAGSAPAQRSLAQSSSAPPMAAASRRRSNQSQAADGLPQREIRFEAVTFSYSHGPCSDGGYALRKLDLVIPAGRSLAIVGANGAGKTTLVKLLCRLYEPTAGRITVDGVDLATLDVASWRRQTAAVFQDSTRFAFTASANIGFGRVDAADDAAGIAAAAVNAGVADLIGGLPQGWDTPLSSQYAGGVDLSGGQWQKIALARALFAVRRGARLLILDEPAAHLDARAEAQLYERFLALTENLTTVVISHRFSTVRQASSIVVLRDGQVVEQGNHDELVARDGPYAQMFRLQAARFTADAEQAVVPARTDVPEQAGSAPAGVVGARVEAAGEVDTP